MLILIDFIMNLRRVTVFSKCFSVGVALPGVGVGTDLNT